MLKKRIPILCAAALVPMLLAPRVASAETNICGDVDGSGIVVATDALFVLRFAVGQDVSLACPAAMAALCWDGNVDGICDDAEDVNG